MHKQPFPHPLGSLLPPLFPPPPAHIPLLFFPHSITIALLLPLLHVQICCLKYFQLGGWSSICISKKLETKNTKSWWGHDSKGLAELSSQKGSLLAILSFWDPVNHLFWRLLLKYVFRQTVNSEESLQNQTNTKSLFYGSLLNCSHFNPSCLKA